MMQSKGNSLRARLFFLLRLVVSVGLVGYLLLQIDWELALDVINRSNKLLLFVVLLITLGSYMVSALRWKTILSDNQVQFPWFQAFRGYLLGLFYGIFLPGVLGGDAIRIGICVQKTRCSVGTSTAAVLLERIGGLVSLFCLLFFSYIVSPKLYNILLPVKDNRLLTWIGIIGIVGLLVVIMSRKLWIQWLPEAQSTTIIGKIFRFVRISASTLATLTNKSLLIVLLYSILFQVFDVIAATILSRAIGLELPWMTFFIVIPVTYLVLLLPISLGGLGVREGTMAFLLSRFGVSTSEAVMFSFLIYLNRMIVGLLGGLFQVVEIFLKKKSDSPPSSSSLQNQ